MNEALNKHVIVTVCTKTGSHNGCAILFAGLLVALPACGSTEVDSTSTAGSSGAAGSSTGGSSGTTGGMSSGGNATGGAGGGSIGGSSGQLGTLGNSCSPPGALACAGTYQKVGLICGADGTWAANQTCDPGQFCDSTPGPDAGTCGDPPAECADKTPGDRFCEGAALMECGVDTLTSILVEDCPQGCADGMCSGPDCPSNVLIDCTDACGGPTQNCYDVCAPDVGAGAMPPVIVLETEGTHIIRTGPSSASACSCFSTAEDGDWFAGFSFVVTSEELFYRVSVDPPWMVDYDAFGSGDGCDPLAIPSPCRWGNATYGDIVRVVTDAPSAPPATVTFEVTVEEPACPQ